jgi:flagellar L-ring protein precursor FlgH
VPLAVLLCVLEGCGPSHIAPFTPKQRAYKPGAYAQVEADAQPSEGSLFSEASPGFLQDTRAGRVGDIVVIRIDEQADAKGDAGTKLSKGSKKDSGIDALAGLVPAMKRSMPEVDPAKLLSLISQSDFAGEGTTRRKGALSGNIAVRVRKRMPNGDLYLEGTKVVMINNEEYHLYISGLIRSADVAQDNTIPSSRVADAQVEFTGRGDVADQVDRGWLTKVLDSINPF